MIYYHCSVRELHHSLSQSHSEHNTPLTVHWLNTATSLEFK